ncbi:hypothetical protein TSAR_002248 [Trichomalopsis sarcophagae]|uniref:Uncharacterized protein n=1 Tax=Trichomalopsis sarcophagae TaxID=543379 RepID=A0A232F2V2_9HYME|nr:hypothetical protein TSAR_002248 [Trichomalopsis sarcophagae]
MVLNTYNKKKRVARVCPNICFFGFSNQKTAFFPCNSLYIRYRAIKQVLLYTMRRANILM